MIDRAMLVKECQRLLRRMEDDVREWTLQDAKLTAQLRKDHAELRNNEQTDSTFESWLDEEVTQAAASWVLACVFVRFMEDNDLITQPYIAGPTGDGAHNRLKRAQEYRSAYFHKKPADSNRNYLQHVFKEVGQIPACRDLFAEDRNPLWRLSVSGDGADELLKFWQETDPDTGRLVRDFVADDISDTRFLGDLYQDLSEAARKRYALLQTPEFVEEFILDYTLDPAIETFGLQGFRMLDLACGSGHFVLGSFGRLLARWEKQAPPGEHREDLVRRALESVNGVDINPFAVAIARFRLMVAALVACDRKRLSDVPAFPLNLATGDSLLMGAGMQLHFKDASGSLWGPDYLVRGDFEEASRILSKKYHAVVANPPYIAVRDRALGQAYRDRYKSCHMKYSLSVPFMERICELACEKGFTGQITSNSFMKREFGKKLIEEYLRTVDMTHVIDSSGAYIPGHGTPTVILFGRKRLPVATTIRTVMGIKGEPSTPADPSQGLVWTAILGQIGQPGSQSLFVSVNDTPREQFSKHPWSIGGGGAAELKERLDSLGVKKLGQEVDSIGITSFTLEDDLYLLPLSAARRYRISGSNLRELLIGDAVRDWRSDSCDSAVFPYTSDFRPIPEDSVTPCLRYLWMGRTVLANNMMFGGKTKVQCGLRWYEFGRLTADKLRTPLSITFAFVATHNHFVLDRGGKVLNRSAPIIKLHKGATEDDHLGLLGLLNSSTACFWGRQTLFPKGGFADGKWEERLEWDGTKLQSFPLTSTRPLPIAKQLDDLARKLTQTLAAAIDGQHAPDAPLLAETHRQVDILRGQMIALQEELDWTCYGSYDMVSNPPRCETPPSLELGQRAFEIVMARKMAAGEETTSWFSRHGSTPYTDLPTHWPPEYRQIVERRIELIENHPNIALLERPEHKRRWMMESWEEQIQKALYNWLCDRLEGRHYWPEAPELVSCRQLADKARHDAEFMQVAELYRGSDTFDLANLVQELVEAESVPYLPALRYKEGGLRKRAQWEAVWESQRREDKGETVDIPIPPRYTSADFQSSVYWRHRGKLDVPKERFVSYPGAERPADDSLVVTWAGYDHAQQAQALATYYQRMKDEEAWSPDRLAPLLSGLDQLVPWIKQWHNDLNPAYGVKLGDFYEDFIRTEAHALNKTLEEIRASVPTIVRASTRNGKKRGKQA